MKDLTQINGVKVDTREKATMPQPNDLTKIVQLDAVDVVLLADGSILYQCMHRNDLDCEYVAESVRSVTAHQRTHGNAKLLRQAQAEAEVLKAELDARVQRRSEGSRQGAITRRTRMVQPTEVGKPERNGGDTQSIVGDGELARAAQGVVTAFNAMQASADEFQKLLVGYLRMAQTKTTEKKVAPIDPAVLEAASNWNDLQRMLGKNK